VEAAMALLSLVAVCRSLSLLCLRGSPEMSAKSARGEKRPPEDILSSKEDD